MALATRQQALRVLAARLKGHHPARELERRRVHLAHLAARLRTLGPQWTLDRGYALVLDQEGHPLTQAKAAREGQAVRLVLGKGVVGATVHETQPGGTLLEVLGAAALEAPLAPPKKSRARKKAGETGSSGGPG